MMLHPLGDMFIAGHGDYKVLTESKDVNTGRWSCTIEVPLQKLDDVNNNARVYSTELMRPVIESIQPLVREKHLVGEYGHPVFEAGVMPTTEQYLRRITTIDPKLMSHSIDKIWIDGKYIMGHVRTLHTHWGQDMTNFIVLDKGTIGFSLRAIGSTQERNGINYVVPQGFVFVTYDAVINPSNPIAKFNPNVKPMVKSPMLESTDYLLKNTNNTQASNGAICINGVCALQESIQNPDVLETVKVTALRGSLLEGLDYLKNLENLE